MENGYVAVDGARLNVRISQADDLSAPWLLFSNSLLTNLSIFDAQVAAFGSQFNIIQYDQRGHGKSEISETVDFSMLAQDALTVMNHAGATSCVFVGLSMGVPTALSAFQAAPDRIKALVLMDGQAASAEGAAEQWQARIDSAQANGMQQLARATSARWLASQVADRDQLESMIAATPLAGFVAGATALKSYDCTAVLEHLSIPTLLIAGAQDGALPARMRSIAQALPNGQFAEVPDAGHIPCFEQPVAVNAALRDFFKTQELI